MWYHSGLTRSIFVSDLGSYDVICGLCWQIGVVFVNEVVSRMFWELEGTCIGWVHILKVCIKKKYCNMVQSSGML
jgi:hypothetical protein